MRCPYLRTNYRSGKSLFCPCRAANKRKWINRMSERRQVPFVPLPCAVIDEVMPTLKDTELRVLLVVIRQTWGWRGTDGKPKERDWLSHRQLKERTGRASEAVSASIDALVRRGLLCVQNEHGTELSGTRERRNAQGRLYYQPGPLLSPLAVRPLRTETDKAKTTTQALAFPCCPFRYSDTTNEANPLEPTATPPKTTARAETAKQAIRKRLEQIKK